MMNFVESHFSLPIIYENFYPKGNKFMQNFSSNGDIFYANVYLQGVIN